MDGLEICDKVTNTVKISVSLFLMFHPALEISFRLKTRRLMFFLSI